MPTRRRNHTKKRVVFVRLDGIGDYVIWSHTFNALDAIYPRSEWERILVGNSVWRELAEREDFFDERIFLNPRHTISNPFYRFRTFRKIRALNADVTVNPRMTREFVLMDSIVRISGSRQRFGSRGIANRMTYLQNRISDGWYTTLADPPERNDHEMDSNFRFLVVLKSDQLSSPEIRKLPGKTQDRTLPANYAVFVPGAQLGDKRWPASKFAAVGRHLADRHGLEILVCGGAEDRPAARSFGTEFGRDLADLTGELTLAELSLVLGKARITVSNDTGAGHIAVACGCPTVVITPGNHVGRFFPYPERLGLAQISVMNPMPCFGCDWHCIYNEIPPQLPKPCVADVAVSEVIRAVDKILVAGPGQIVSGRFEKLLT